MAMKKIKRYSPNMINFAHMTLITAHSGCEATLPNSREHVIAALASGAEYIEVDVRYDGEQLYLAHDLPEDPSKCFKFDSMLSLASEYPSVFLNCDVKTEGLEELVMEAARRYGVAHRILFTGECNKRFCDIVKLGGDIWHSLWRCEDNERSIKEAVAHCLDVGCKYINLDRRMLSDEMVEYVHSKGLKISVWTVDDEAEIKRFLSLGVDNITTRKPSLALALRDDIQGSPDEKGFLADGSIEEIIRKAGKIMEYADREKICFDQKAGAANFVTEYDVKVQKYLEAEFKELMDGDCAFLAEEEGENENPLGEGYTFIIDPIDGTTNFMIDRRNSCISVGLLKNKKPFFGAVYNPYDKRYYYAFFGKGAYRDHKAIHVSDRDAEVAIVSIGSAPYYKDMVHKIGVMTEKMLKNFADVRRIASAALEACAVACGELDGYCEPILGPWDYAAGALIINEAGGKTSDFEGKELGFDFSRPAVFGTPKTYDILLDIVKSL